MQQFYKPRTGFSTRIAIILGVVIIGSLLFVGIVFASSSSDAENRPNPSRVIKIDGVFDRDFTSLGELKGASTLIVLGTVKEQEITLNSHGVPSTISTLTIERALKGAIVPNQVVGVKQLGGVAKDGAQWEMENFPLLMTGTRYVLFLTPSPLQDVFYPVGAPQGVYISNVKGEINSLTAPATKNSVTIHNTPIDQFISDVQATPDIPSKP